MTTDVIKEKSFCECRAIGEEKRMDRMLGDMDVYI